MKIIQLIHATQLRGAEVFACQLAEHLKEAGNEVTIFSLYDRGAEMPTSIPIHHLNCKRAFDHKNMAELARYIRLNEVDIIQTNAGDTLKFAALSKILFRWKAKLVVRNATTMSDLLHSKAHKFAYQILFKVVDQVISVTQHEANDIVSLFPFCETKTCMIPIGIELPKGNELYVPSHDKIILHVGAFSKEKNHEGLIRIHYSTLQRYPDAELWLVGEGPLEQKIRELVKHLDISSQVKFLGRRDDVAVLMKQASVLALPSFTEGLPGVILEAMSHALPVIANDVGGIREVIEPGVTGWLIPRDDEAAFAAQLVNILHDPASARPVALKAQQLVRRDHRNDTISKKFYTVYKSLTPATA